MLRLLRIAARNLRRNKRRTAISLLALIFGVGVMVGLRGFINGQRSAMLSGIVQGQLGALQVHKKGYLANVQALPLTFDMVDSPAVRAKLAAIPGVTAVAPRIAFGAMVSTPPTLGANGEPVAGSEGDTAYFAATAIDPAPESKVTPRRWTWIGEGQMPSSPEAAELVLNADFNKGLGAKVTPPSSVPPGPESPALLAADRDGALNGAPIRLSGTLLSASPGDKRYGLVPLATAQRLLRMEGRVTEYALGVTDVEDSALLERIKHDAEAALGPEYEVHTWEEIMPFIRTLLRTQDIVFGSITAIFLVIALLGIVNTLLMSVLERVREIGTMLAVGAKRAQIVTLFVFEGLVQGLIGGAFGVLLGVLLVAWMSHRGINLPAPGSQVPQTIHPFVAGRFLLVAELFAGLGSAIAALYPAYRASRLRPVEALAST